MCEADRSYHLLVFNAHLVPAGGWLLQSVQFFLVALLDVACLFRLLWGRLLQDFGQSHHN